MSFDGLLTQTVALLEPAADTDDDGNPVDDWGSATSTDSKGLLQQTSAIEVTLGRDTVISDWLLFLPADAAVDAVARVVVDGSTFEVVGRPDLVRTPRGVHHVEVRLRLVEG